MSDIGDRVKRIVVEHLGVEADKVTDSASFIDDLGADSLDTVELVMTNQLDQIESLVERATNAAGRQPEAIRQRLTEQVKRLIETGAGLDPERLHQEALLLAAKSDIQEELDRLRSHVAAANELLAQDQPAGRRLEFLAQEFNREANTLCSKASDIEISRAGLELKSVIDQLREQVQNIE